MRSIIYPSTDKRLKSQGVGFLADARCALIFTLSTIVGHRLSEMIPRWAGGTVVTGFV
jgi:hypothetical protein